MTHYVSMKTPLQTWATLEEISKDLEMVPSYPDRWGRCIVLISSNPYSLEQIAAKANQIVERLQPLDFRQKLQCSTVLQALKKIRGNSDKQRSKITRHIHCCECSTGKFFALEKTLVEKQSKQQPQDESGPAIPMEKQI